MEKHITEKDWTTKSGLRAVIIKMNNPPYLLHRCGYVAVGKDSPLFGVGYSDQADCLTRDMASNSMIGKKSPILAFTAGTRSDGDGMIRRSPDVIFDVHGGLTYSSAGGGYPVPSKDAWWFGFDAGHHDDTDNPKSLDYMIGECESLANQLSEFNSPE